MDNLATLGTGIGVCGVVAYMYIESYSIMEVVIFLLSMIPMMVFMIGYYNDMYTTTSVTSSETNISLISPDADQADQTEGEPEGEPMGDTDGETDGTLPAQPFHVQGRFDYKTAKNVCKSYGAKLATLAQMQSGYKKGAEWCDYGWSAGKLALYPTQEETWLKNQNTPYEDSCGIPGLNGGYANPIQHMGVNCFGNKPAGEMPDTPIVPAQVDARVAYWQSQNLTVSPFNYTEWSEL
jgi:hypothetical protein